MATNFSGALRQSRRFYLTDWTISKAIAFFSAQGIWLHTPLQKIAIFINNYGIRYFTAIYTVLKINWLQNLKIWNRSVRLRWTNPEFQKRNGSTQLMKKKKSQKVTQKTEDLPWKFPKRRFKKRKCVLVVARLREVRCRQLGSFDAPLDLHQLESIDGTAKKSLTSTFNWFTNAN